MRIVCFMREESMVKAKKIKLQKRSVPDARVHEGLSLPAGAGGSGHIGFKNTADLKAKYFVRTGRLGRVPLRNSSLPLSYTAAWRKVFC